SKARNVTSKVFGSHFGRGIFPTIKTIKLIDEIKPDVVHLHCLNGHFINIYRLLDFLKKANIPTILTMHAEFMYTGGCGHAFECENWKTGCGHCPDKSRNNGTFSFGRDNSAHAWKRMKKAFEGFDNLTVVSVSEWLMNRAKLSPILEDKKHVVVHNGIDTQVFRLYNVDELDEEIKSIFSKRPAVFHSTPSFESEIKGGKYVLELADKMPNIQFVVAGDYDKTKAYPANIKFLGRISEQRILAQCYGLADLTVLTSKKETFSMVVAESLCCGTPIVGFEAGAPETIAIKEFSEFVEFASVDKLKLAIEQWLSKSLNKMDISNQAQEKFDSKQMAKKYLELYKGNNC
ncbi:MAG: glycosyltransferase, partial [Clostridia bacterium]